MHPMAPHPHRASVGTNEPASWLPNPTSMPDPVTFNPRVARPWRDEPIGVDGAGLADSMRAVNRLRFDGRVPPGIVKHHITRSGQVQPRAGCAKTEQEHGGV